MKTLEKIENALARYALTPREQDVFTCLRRGENNYQIAESLGMGVNTVRTHTRSIRQKTGATTRGAAVATLFEVDSVDRLEAQVTYLLRTLVGVRRRTLIGCKRQHIMDWIDASIAEFSKS